jgi:RNA polymerase sigma factor (sigma-70 family)
VSTTERTADPADSPDLPPDAAPGAGAVTSGVAAAIVDRVAAGDHRALTELYDRFAGPVYSLARRICGDGDIAEDATHDVFLAVWRTASRFDPARGTVAAWLLAVAHHRAVDAVRRDPHRLAARPTPELRSGAEADAAPDDGSILTGQVRELVAGLAPEQREALGLAYFGGHTQSEVAEMLAIPLGDVKARTVMATDQLRPLTALIRELP